MKFRALIHGNKLGYGSAHEIQCEHQYGPIDRDGFIKAAQSRRGTRNRQRTHRISSAKQVEQRLQKLENQVATLASMFGDSVEIELGPFEQWMQTQSASKFAGKHVAYLPSENKVIYSSESLAELLGKLRAIDPENKSVVGLVPG